MELVITRDQVIENLRVFHGYRSDSDERVRNEYGDLLRRGRKFVVGRIGDGYAFAPSRFVGYQGVTLRRHQDYTYKHGTRTTNAINGIMGKHLPNPAIDTEYTNACASFGVLPNKIDNREFWMLEEYLAGQGCNCLNHGKTGQGEPWRISWHHRIGII